MSNESPTPRSVHLPVLLNEVLEGLRPGEGEIFVDGTAGAGGHSAALARKVGPAGRIIGLDLDPNMLRIAAEATEGLPVTLVRSSYSEMPKVLEARGIDGARGILLDLGLSSDQLAWRERGFSFSSDGPLDMRFDPDADTTAADLVNRLSAEDLATVLYEYGEERHSRRIARRIVEARRIAPIRTCSRLAEIVRSAYRGPRGPIDPATRTFQALRIKVNDELGKLETLLKNLPDLLLPGGRAAIISFHSLEDRIVKWAFRNEPRMTVLTRKPVTATPEELAENPRARSAKLRVAERCSTQIRQTTP